MEAGFLPSYSKLEGRPFNLRNLMRMGPSTYPAHLGRRARCHLTKRLDQGLWSQLKEPVSCVTVHSIQVKTDSGRGGTAWQHYNSLLLF